MGRKDKIQQCEVDAYKLDTSMYLFIENCQIMTKALVESMTDNNSNKFTSAADMSVSFTAVNIRVSHEEITGNS